MFRALVFLLALTAGGVAAWLAFALSGEAPATTIVQAAPPQPMQEVLVASVDLGQGQTIAPDSLRWQSWPEDALNPNFISREARPDALEKLQGSVVRNQVLSGEPLREDKLVQSDSGFLSTILPSGKRAVAVRVSVENTAGGFILPNDRVDVIQTSVRPSPSRQAENVSVTLLTNIRVLAIDQLADNTETTLVGRTATLELDARQAEIITAAEASGSLSLALRSAADADEQQTQHHAGGFVRVFRGGQGEIVKLR